MTPINMYFEPNFSINKEEGIILLNGKSNIENSLAFYKPLLEQLKEYIAEKPVKIYMYVDLEFFNTTSSKCMLDMFRLLTQYYKDGYDAKIFWYHEEDDEEIEEAGYDYQSIVRMPFEVKVK